MRYAGTTPQQRALAETAFLLHYEQGMKTWRLRKGHHFLCDPWGVPRPQVCLFAFIVNDHNNVGTMFAYGPPVFPRYIR